MVFDASEYTQRALKEPKDRLYALVGLAKDVARGTRKRYCAGLWCENMPLQVLWYSRDGNMVRLPFQRAPSWSWAARDGAVSWEPVMLEADPRCGMSVPGHLQGFDPAEMISATICYTGVIKPVRRSERTFVEGEDM